MRRALLPVAAVAASAVLLAGCVSGPSGLPAVPAVVAPLPSVLTPPTSGPTDTADAVLASARRWAYRIRSTDCLATGSAFDLAGTLVTNRHVAIGSRTVQVSSWDGTDFDATVRALAGGPDLALLTPQAVLGADTGATPAKAEPAVGSPVWAAGYPEGDQLTVTPGRVLGYLTGKVVGVPERVIRVSNPIRPGNSGSALVDSAGEVVGVVFALETDDGDGLAIPLTALNTFLKAPGRQTAGACSQD